MSELIVFKVGALKSTGKPVDENGPGLKGPASEAWTSRSPGLARGAPPSMKLEIDILTTLPYYKFVWSEELPDRYFEYGY